MGRLALAAIAFAFHAPGLRCLGHRLRPPIFRLNVVAVGLTLLAMAAAGLTLEPRWLAVAGAWAAGHFAWSSCLAYLVLAGKALTASRREAESPSPAD